MIVLLAAAALATPSFDPTTTDAVFAGAEVYDATGSIQLWSRIERHVDSDPALFAAGEFNTVTAWADNTAFAPWIGTCFGSGTPDGSAFLLHEGVRAATASGTPILFVPGAGDNASRGFVTMATRMDLSGRPVYALTFSHPHGDVFEQAEIIADAIARIRERTGAPEVDVVSHSKGGISVAIYLSHHAAADWGDTRYEAVGTHYRGDVRRAVFIATPLGGIDTGYRWPLANLIGTSADTAYAPSSWRTYYPYTTSVPGITTDLREQDFLPSSGDLFPGQRQLLLRQDYAVPGSLPWLGAYALQPDWYTTYEGGYGYYSYSDGIDAAIEAGGNVIDRVTATGVDPSVDLYVLAGQNPLMPNGTEDLLVSFFGAEWVDIATAGVDVWSSLVADATGDGLISAGITDDEVHGLSSGDLILGEISGPSDGLVFVTSATAGDRLTARGAEVVETYVANLSHLDLLYASPITGSLLIAEAEADPLENRWMAAVGARYIEADTLGWVERVLADEVVDTGGDTGGDTDTDTDTDTGGDTEEDTDAPDDTGPVVDTDTGDDAPKPDEEGCGGGCAAPGQPGGAGTLALALAGLALARRRRA